MPDINWFAVVLAAFVPFLIGGFWYSPVLFYRPWLRLNGFTEDSVKGGRPAIIFGTSFVLQLVMAAVLAMFIHGQALAFAVAASVAVGVAWVATAFGVTYLFERRPLALLAINAGYHVVAFFMMGLILGAWE